MPQRFARQQGNTERQGCDPGSSRPGAVRLPGLIAVGVFAIVVALLIWLISAGQTEHADAPKRSHLLLDHPAAIRAFASSTDCRLAFSGWDGNLAILNLETHGSVGTISLIPLQDRRDGNCLSFSPDGSLLAVEQHDGKVEILDARSQLRV